MTNHPPVITMFIGCKISFPHGWFIVLASMATGDLPIAAWFISWNIPFIQGDAPVRERVQLVYVGTISRLG